MSNLEGYNETNLTGSNILKSYLHITSSVILSHYIESHAFQNTTLNLNISSKKLILIKDIAKDRSNMIIFSLCINHDE